MILPTGPATGNRTCILEKKRQQGFSGETTLVVPRCLLNRVAATAAFLLFTEKSAVESSRGKKAFDERIAARLENIEQCRLIFMQNYCVIRGKKEHRESTRRRKRLQCSDRGSTYTHVYIERKRERKRKREREAR